jgi:hypothetical protein
MLTLANILPIKAIQKQAMADAVAQAGRHDVPQGLEVVPDLRDIKGRWWGTKGGGRLTGELLMADLLQGSASVVVPLLIATLPVLTLLAWELWHITPKLGVLIGLPLFAVFYLLYSAIGTEGNRSALASCVILPLIGLAGSSLAAGGIPGAEMIGGMGGGGPLGWVKMLAIPVAALGGVLFLFSSNKGEAKRNLLTIAQVLGGLGILATVTSTLLPASLQPLMWFAIASYMPWHWSRKQAKARAIQLARQGSRFTAEDSGRLAAAHQAARKEQVANTNKDKSGFIEIGTSLGILTKYGDGYAPDAGLPFGMSPRDATTHFHVTGETGTGKTFSILIPFIIAWILQKAGGVLILDGKGSLAARILRLLVGLRNVLLIEPGVKLGLIQGLSPEDLVMGISDVGGAKKQEASANAEQFFNTSATTMLGHIALLLYAVVAIEKRLEKEGNLFQQSSSKSGDGALTFSDNVDEPRERLWFWVLRDVYTMLLLLQDEHPGSAEILAMVRKHDSKASAGARLSDAINYITGELWPMDPKLKSSILATVLTWITPIMNHPELQPWSVTEDGEDPTICLRGGLVGVSLPEFMYGIAGKMCQSLVKQRVFAGTRGRALRPNWQAEGETSVLFVVDEAQELISQADRDFLPVAREHGGACLYATQSVDGYEARMGDASTRAFLANFVSTISLKSTYKTYEWLAQKFGHGEFFAWNVAAAGIDFIGTAMRVARSPLYDPNHPDARQMRKLRRRGAGQLREPQIFGRGGEAYWRGMGVANAEVDYNINDVKIDIITQGQREKRALLSMEDCAAYLDTPRVAVAQVMRGGVLRRDFIRFPFSDGSNLANLRKVLEGREANQTPAATKEK